MEHDDETENPPLADAVDAAHVVVDPLRRHPGLRDQPLVITVKSVRRGRVSLEWRLMTPDEVSAEPDDE